MIVTVEQFCDWTGVDAEAVAHSTLDLTVGVAQEAVERYCDRRFEEATHTEYHDAGPVASRSVEVRNPPINSVTTLQYDSQASSPTTVGTDDRFYQNGDSYGRITLYNAEAYFGRGEGGGEKSIKIVYSGGYEPAALPRMVRMATLMTAQWLWDNRDQVGLASYAADGESATVDWSAMVPNGARALLSPWRRVSL